MFTRKDYIDGNCTHHQYYEQLANESNARTILLDYAKMQPEELAEKLAQDQHLNNIPLHTWDTLGVLLAAPFEKYGDYPTESGKVCTLKAMAKIIANEYNTSK